MACLIYLHTQKDPSEVSDEISRVLGVGHSGKVTRWSFESPSYYVSIRKNEFADESEDSNFPDGFLHFPLYVEFSESDDAPEAETVATIGRILRYFWDQGVPAVAESSLEELLPLDGGYGHAELPWPP